MPLSWLKILASLPMYLFGCVSSIRSVRFSSFARSGMRATKQWWSFCFNGISVAKTNSRQIIMQLFLGITNYLFMVCLSVACVYGWEWQRYTNNSVEQKQRISLFCSSLLELTIHCGQEWYVTAHWLRLPGRLGHPQCLLPVRVARRMCIWILSHYVPKNRWKYLKWFFDGKIRLHFAIGQSPLFNYEFHFMEMLKICVHCRRIFSNISEWIFFFIVFRFLQYSLAMSEPICIWR